MRLPDPCNRLTKRPRSDGVKCEPPIDSNAKEAGATLPLPDRDPTDALKYNRAFGWNAKVAHVVRFDASELRCP